ncbi:hypothetical protein CISIN_1g034784mg [Citrus sinensis]|uniref:Uncharacterized protein n=1 Tax=Citrus sinensis TaxID=2711 RepID=A0A067EMJ2_CITSI|nr:hypothetical protein CISIN_1g034784mg [Citrus sinensis]
MSCLKSSNRSTQKLKTLDFSLKTLVLVYLGAQYHHFPVIASVMWVSPSGMDMDNEKSNNFAIFFFIESNVTICKWVNNFHCSL